jgi:hypothetical protein
MQADNSAASRKSGLDQRVLISIDSDSTASLPVGAMPEKKRKEHSCFKG